MFEFNTNTQGRVLLQKAVFSLIEMADQGTFYVSRRDEDVTLVASNSRDPNAVAALRMSSLSAFNNLSRCDRTRFCFQFNLRELYDILIDANEDELYTLNLTWPAEGDNHNNIDIVFENSAGNSEEYELSLTEYSTTVSDDEIPKWLDENFNIFVAIPLDQFTELIRDLVSYGTAVYAYVSADRVTFIAGNMQLVLKTKHGQCTIQGVDDDADDEICLAFSIHYSKAILNAAVLTNEVCLQGRTNGGGPAKLSYDVGDHYALGELMILFP